MNRERVTRRIVVRWSGALMLIIWLLGIMVLPPSPALEVAAQDEGDAGPEPPRLVARKAPAHEPRILERTVLANGATNTIIELPAEADAYIASEWPNQNFGAESLYLGYNLTGTDNFGAERMLLYFDVQGNVPPDVVINEARLNLHLNFSSPQDDEPMGTILRRLCSTWSETEVTWNREPVWHEIRSEAEVGSIPNVWYEWEITTLVEDWLAETYPNHGVEIIGDETVQQRERAFDSRETTNEAYPRLVVDYTYYADDQPPDVAVDPLPAFVDRDFTVAWSGDDAGGSGIASYDVQYRVDGGDWADWIEDTTYTSAVFAAGEDGRFYEFRARGEDRAGNVEAYGAPEASTTVDARSPTTVVDPLPTITGSTSFTVSWTGQDDGSGIQYYDVRYRYNDGSWHLWQNQTLATSTTFNAMDDGLYEFEARAVDNVGMREDFRSEAEASIIVDAVAPFVEPRVWVPLVVRGR